MVYLEEDIDLDNDQHHPVSIDVVKEEDIFHQQTGSDQGIDLDKVLGIDRKIDLDIDLSLVEILCQNHPDILK